MMKMMKILFDKINKMENDKKKMTRSTKKQTIKLENLQILEQTNLAFKNREDTWHILYNWNPQ